MRILLISVILTVVECLLYPLTTSDIEVSDTGYKVSRKSWRAKS